MGHYIEAGVAYYNVTKNKQALEIAEKMADCIDRNFGDASDKIHGYDGHPEIELALTKLYDCTHNKKYLKSIKKELYLIDIILAYWAFL